MYSNGQTAAGVTVPDTKLARDATELVRESTTDLIYNHSRRVYWFGSLQGRNRGLSFDPELLYIGAMFHDLGLNEQFRGSGRRFEVDSADEARRFLQGHGVPEVMSGTATAALTELIPPASGTPGSPGPAR
jgi:HD superfamily phosphodiesterase